MYECLNDSYKTPNHIPLSAIVSIKECGGPVSTWLIARVTRRQCCFVRLSDRQRLGRHYLLPLPFLCSEMSHGPTILQLAGQSRRYRPYVTVWGRRFGATVLEQRNGLK